MQANQNQKLSMKDRITAHLPGHKNQDNNGNGIPDRMEKNSAASTTGHRTLSDMNGNGVPDRLERGGLATGVAPSNDLNRNGIPDQLEGRTSQTSTTTGFTDLNRNGIPDQLEGQGFGFVGSVAATQTSVVDVREAPVMVERIEKAAIVHEVYKTEEVVQIQPVIEREREQLDVYEVMQPMREREVIATEVRYATLAPQTRATIVEDNSAFLAQRSAPTDFSTREVAATRSQTIENAPIIHETIVHKIIEEVQPVIYKEIDRPILVKETLPIYEKIVEAPHAHHNLLPMRDLGTRSVTTSTGFTDLNRDGIPDQLQGGMYQTTGHQSQGLYAQDRNRNGIPDNLERGQFAQAGILSQPTIVGQQQWGQQGGLNDRNGNGIPDNLEARQGQKSLHDLNGNGIPDRMEKAHGLKDLNGNGVDDSLERRMGQTSLRPNTTF